VFTSLNGEVQLIDNIKSLFGMASDSEHFVVIIIWLPGWKQEWLMGKHLRRVYVCS